MLKKLTKNLADRFMKSQRPISLSINSQPHVLKYRMVEEQLTHGTKSLVDLNDVRLVNGRNEDNEEVTEIYFCPLGRLKVKEILQYGDGKSIPDEVELRGIKSPKKLLRNIPGIYALKNVILHSNGVMSLESTPLTEWERVPGEH